MFLVYFVIPMTGFNGFIITIYAGNMINATLSLNRLVKKSNMSLPVNLWIIRPAIAVCGAGIPVFVLCNRILLNMGLSVPAVLMITVTAVLYVMFLFPLGCVDKGVYLRMKRKLIKVGYDGKDKYRGK